PGPVAPAAPGGAAPARVDAPETDDDDEDDHGAINQTTPPPINATSAISATRPPAAALPDRRVLTRRGTPRLAYRRRAGMRWAEYSRPPGLFRKPLPSGGAPSAHAQTGAHQRQS